MMPWPSLKEAWFWEPKCVSKRGPSYYYSQQSAWGLYPSPSPQLWALQGSQRGHTLISRHNKGLIEPQVPTATRILGAPMSMDQQGSSPHIDRVHEPWLAWGKMRNTYTTMPSSCALKAKNVQKLWEKKVGIRGVMYGSTLQWEHLWLGGMTPPGSAVFMVTVNLSLQGR